MNILIAFQSFFCILLLQDYYESAMAMKSVKFEIAFYGLTTGKLIHTNNNLMDKFNIGI